MDAGSTFLWDCTATGTPIPALAWTKDGVKLQSGTPEHISILSNNSLVITGVRPEDGGQYQCHARNGVGAHVVQATLTVRGETLGCYLVLVLGINLSELSEELHRGSTLVFTATIGKMRLLRQRLRFLSLRLVILTRRCLLFVTI